MSGKIFHNMQEVHYCRLESQSNIYGLTKFATSPDENKVLVTSLHGKVMSVAFQKDKTIPVSREVTFTYIPGDAEVISMDSFYRNDPVGVVIAIAFIKISEGRQTNYLNIYSEWEAGSELDLDKIALGCQSLDLNFVPYQLYHAEIQRVETETETVFLMSADDGQVHMFQEAKNTHMFVEEKIDEHFPEFVSLPGIVIWMHCVTVSDKSIRLSAYGCQNGVVGFCVVDLLSKSVVKSYRIEHDSPISSVRLFTLRNEERLPAPDITNGSDVQPTLFRTPTSLSDYHLLVTSSLELSVVYTNVVDRGLVDTLVLPESDVFDTVTCSLVTDIDFDGVSEVLLGTYGQELLLYKFKPRSSSNAGMKNNSRQGGVTDQSASAQFDQASEVNNRSRNSDDQTATLVVNGSFPSRNLIHEGEFTLVARRGLPDPILALNEADMTADGLNELIVLSHSGLHIIQHDLQAAAELCLQRLQQFAIVT